MQRLLLSIFLFLFFILFSQMLRVSLLSLSLSLSLLSRPFSLIFKNIWMHTIVPQDNRRKSSIYWEATNSLLFRKCWETAISANADWVFFLIFLFFFFFFFFFYFGFFFFFCFLFFFFALGCQK